MELNDPTHVFFPWTVATLTCAITKVKELQGEEIYLRLNIAYEMQDAIAKYGLDDKNK
jgi:hypothetical protein